jgi:hypothetical protein
MPSTLALGMRQLCLGTNEEKIIQLFVILIISNATMVNCGDAEFGT